jgi:hypothetical protein
MKKVLLFVTAAFFGGTILAQEQGSMFLSGNTGLDFDGLNVSDIDLDPCDGCPDWDGTNKTNTINFDLSGGYFFMDGLAVGLGFSMDQTKTTTNSGSDGESDYVDTETTTMFGPLVRYYIGETGVFTRLAYMMGSSKDEHKHDDDSHTDEISMSQLGIGAGYAISLSDNVALNPIVTYHMDNWKIDGEDGGPDTSIKASGLKFNIGLTITM